MTENNEYCGPLAGLNVIDFGHYYAGPMVGMLLADQGANVIRIVRPGEPELPSQQYRLLNRNKKLLTLDLKTEEGKAQALSLIEKADVVIENFRPGVMKRLGLDYASLKADNPGHVYLSLPGFASTDAERSHIQAWEGVLSAAAGVYTMPNLLRSILKFPPVYSSIPQCSMYGAMHGVVGIMAGLIARKEHGHGTVIETPLVDAGLSGFIMDFQYSMLPLGPWAPDLRLPEALEHLIYSPEDNNDEQIKKLKRAQLSTAFVGTPCTRFHTCLNGRQILLFPMWDDEQFVKRMLKAMNIDTQLMRKGFVTVSPWQNPGLDNNICDCNNLSTDKRARLTKTIDDAFLTKTAHEWEEIFQRARVPAAMVRTRQEWMALPSLSESGVFTTMTKGKSTLIVPGRVAHVSSSPSQAKEDLNNTYEEAESITVKEASELFGHCIDFNVSKSNSPSLSKGELLRGLKVLDMSSLFAGPAGAYFLAGFGAEVIKVDPCSPTPPGPQRTFFPGKRSIVTDMKSAPGQEVLSRLVSETDIVLHNCLGEAAKRLGVTHKQLGKINPNIITAQFSAYGGTSRGGIEGRQGVEPLLQAASGLMAHFGTRESPQYHGMVAAADCIGGLALAFSALLGVYQRQLTGQAGEVRTSLAQATNYYQLPWMIDENGNSQWEAPSGQFALGEDAWRRLYACRDGWIYVATTDTHASDFFKTVTQQSTSSTAALETAFAEQSCRHWLTTLSAADIACHQVLDANDIYRRNVRHVAKEDADERAACASELLSWDNSDFGYPIYLLAPNCVRVGESNTYRRLGKTPILGEHTTEILEELDYSKNDIEELIELQIAYQYTSDISLNKA
ncbi:CoA transferase [SAR92 clade bacterium H231]|nr:CoA transferase [SAR92 clade bacterium H231]